MAKQRSNTPPLKKVTNAVVGVIDRVEKHKDSFDTDTERSAAIWGYLTVLGVNLLSCGSLALYFANMLTAAGEINCELAFLVIKGFIEYMTGKLSTPLVAHHSIMIIGFIALQFPWAECYIWTVVHAQLVHVPFALRALWRLLMPELRLVSPGSALREAVDAVFWAIWMTLCGYRTLVIIWYAMWAQYTFALGARAALAAVTISGIGLLDKGWTDAMWPKPKEISPTFVVFIRFFFVVGVVLSLLVWLLDTHPEMLGPLPALLIPDDHVDTYTCLAAQREAAAAAAAAAAESQPGSV